jgi:hypothetical protein
MTDRYDTTGNPEDEYYPGASVLINLEDIHDPEELFFRTASSNHTGRRPITIHPFPVKSNSRAISSLCLSRLTAMRRT